jgi:hypothetical protein
VFFGLKIFWNMRLEDFVNFYVFQPFEDFVFPLFWTEMRERERERERERRELKREMGCEIGREGKTRAETTRDPDPRLEIAADSNFDTQG